MKNSVFLLINVLLITSCTRKEAVPKTNLNERFGSELQELKDYFQIPGLAVLVQKGDSIVYEDHLGYANLEHQKKVDSTTLFPIASVTKVFSAVALLQLQEQGKLSLEDPINSYVPQSNLGDSIQIKHILSHTSQGPVGDHFYYSYRFGMLTPVIEKAADTSFPAFLKQAIFAPLQLKQTYLLTDSSAVTATMARPYDLDEGAVPGKVEYGVSAAAGIVSNLKDLAKFSRALDTNALLTKASKDRMYIPFQSDLPYGYGIFTQQLEGKAIRWAYGQYDSYSSLLLKVPEDDLTLVLLANNNLMSDPARLINGDVTTSLFAMSFFKNYVLHLEGVPLFEPDAVDSSEENRSEFHRKKLLAEALAASYMARFDNAELEKSKQLLRKTFTLFPDYLNYGDLNLLHTLTFLKDVHFYMDLGAFNDFDAQIEAIANTLLTQDPNNPYAHVYLGTYFDRKGDSQKARFHFEALVNQQNFSPFWYTVEAKQWLAAHE